MNKKPLPPFQVVEPAKVEVPALQDFRGTLDELHVILHDLMATYGRHATLELDAGHNNVSVYLTPIAPPSPRKGGGFTW